MEQQNQQLTVVEKNGKTSLALRGGLLGSAVALASMSNANAAGSGIDVSSVVSTITDGVTTVSSIGLAVLSLVVVIKVFKWARSAM